MKKTIIFNSLSAAKEQIKRMKNKKNDRRQRSFFVNLSYVFYKLFLQKQRIQVLAAGYTELGIKSSRIGLDRVF